MDCAASENAVGAQHARVELSEAAVAVLVLAAVNERVSAEKGGLVVDEPERRSLGAEGKIVNRLAEDGGALLLIGSVLED